MRVFGPFISAGFESLAADPSGNLFAGRIYYNSVSKRLRAYNGTAWVEYVTASDSQTLTNITLASGTVITAGKITTAVSEVDPVDNTKQWNATLASATTGTATTFVLAQTANRTITIPDATDTLVGRATTDTLTNKTLTAPSLAAPVVSNYEDFTEIASPASPGAGVVRLYSKSGDNLYTKNSAGTETQLGSGSGEKNYVQAGSSTASGWMASGAGVTVANDTTAADLPRPNTTQTGIKVTGISGSTAYAYYRFILDDADANKKLKVQCDLKPISLYASNDFQISVYSNTASDYTTGNARLPLSTDSSAVTGIPSLTGTFRTTFDAPAVTAKWIEVRIGLNGTNTHALVISDLVVGPGAAVQGAVTSGWQSYTPTVNNNGSKVFTNIAQWRRVGDTMEIKFSLTGNATASGSAATTRVQMTLPTGFTINTSALPDITLGNLDNVLGTVQTFGIETSAQFDRDTVAIADTSTAVAFIRPGTATGYQTTHLNAAQAMSFQGHVAIPVNEWAGAGTVNVVQNDCEYVSNSSTSTSASDTSSFVSGPSGSKIQAITAALARRVRFQVPIQASDAIQIEISADQLKWLPLIGQTLPSNSGASQVCPFAIQNGVGYGIGQMGFVNATDVDINFGAYSYPSGATYGAAGSAWSTNSGNLFWRVRKLTGGQAIGFSIAQPGLSAGLISANGTPGVTTSSTAPTGYVGEYLESKTTATNFTGATGTAMTGTTVALTAGDWDCQYFVTVYMNGSTMTTLDAQVWISATAGNSFTGLSVGTNQEYQAPSPGSAGRIPLNSPLVRVTSDGTNLTIDGAAVAQTVLQGKVSIGNFSAGTPQYSGFLRCRRAR